MKRHALGFGLEKGSFFILLTLTLITPFAVQADGVFGMLPHLVEADLEVRVTATSETTAVAPRFETPKRLDSICQAGRDESEPWVSPDGLRIYYTIDHDPGNGIAQEIYVASRASLSDDFADPVRVDGLGDSTQKNDHWLSQDELAIYLRVGACGSIATATRSSISEAFTGYHTIDYLPALLDGNCIASPALTADQLHLLVTAPRSIYQLSRDTVQEEFADPVELASLNSDGIDGHTWLSDDGLEVYFSSTRNGMHDLYYSSRSSLTDAFAAPSPVSTLNTSHEDSRPFFHSPTKALYFIRNEGVQDTFDIYVAYLEGAAPPSIPFVDATEGSGLPDFPHTGESRTAVAFSDLNNDGHLDLIRQNAYYLGQGDGTFSAPTLFPGLSSNVNATGAACGDYDNDGDADVLLSFRENGVALYRNEGGFFTNVSTTANVIPRGRTIHSLFVDFNNDGFLDIYQVNGDSSSPSLTQNVLLLGTSSGVFTDHSIASGAALTTSGHCAVAFDYDLDGDLDLYLTAFQPRSTHHLLRNDGSARFTDVTTQSGLSAPLNQYGYADFGDFDGDGLPDLYICNLQSSDTLYRNNGDGTFSDASHLLDNNTGRYSWNAGFLDFDLDGDLDLLTFAWEGDSYYSLAFANQDGERFEEVTGDVNIGALTGRSGHAVGDLNGDGALDIYGISPDIQTLLLGQPAPGHNHLLVQTVGVISNRNGIGAQLTAEVGGRTLTRQVGGKLADSLEAEFGLGAATQVDRLTIRWPSGIVQALYNVAANQRITVIETVQFTASIVPALPRIMDDLHCAVDAEQSLAPGDLAYRWFRNGTLLTEPKNVNNVILPVDGPSLSRWFTTKNETYYCSVDFDTGSGLMTVNTLPVTIQNTPPTAPVVEIRPATPRAGQDLGINILVYSQDADNDPIKYAIRWYESENGGFTWVHKVELDDSPFISGSVYIEEGDLWRVEVIPYEDTGGFFAKSGDALAASVIGDIGWDLVYIGENARPVLTITDPSTGGALADPAVTIRWAAQDSDGDPIGVDLYYDEDGVKGGEILIAEGLPAEGDLSWTPPLTALPTGLDQNGDLYLDHRDLFHMAAGWQASPTGGVHIFGRARDSKGAIGEAFSPGPAYAADSALLTAESIMAAQERWHQRR